MSELPGILADIEALCARDAALDLAEALGGQTLHVPQRARLSGGSPLRVLDEEFARRICRRFGGEQIYIPQARRAVALRMYEKGASTKEVATRLGVSRRWARNIRR